MQLKIRPAPYILPSYSLTSHLLSFLRCGLQYRYNNIGRLPTTEPVQLWFGQFIHGVMEESYRRFRQRCQDSGEGGFPWPEEELDDICALIERRLLAQGLRAWENAGLELGRNRAKTAVSELGPDLFPLIDRAEVRLTGARFLPAAISAHKARPTQADRYEIAGVVDVLTHVQLRDPALRRNHLLGTILGGLPACLPDEFEVIIDYKGTRRPPASRAPRALSKVYNWQVQTYAHLRSRQEGSRPVVAGVILYLNELLPSRGDLQKLRQEVREGRAEPAPRPGTADHQAVERLSPGGLSALYRLERTVAVFPVSPESIQEALSEFDAVVERIETCAIRERLSGRIIGSWERNNEDEGTCAACDARTFCPDYAKEKQPALPGYA